jgi:glycerol-3-phosphate acyltransferase PlsY
MVALASRYSSLASLTAAVAAPILSAVWDGVGAKLAILVAISVLLVWRHRSNIAKLRAGTEGRIGGTAST